MLQDLRVTLESDLVKSRSYSVAVEETLSEAVSALEAKNQENLNLKADLENALKESELKSAKLADIENECTALVSSCLLLNIMHSGCLSPNRRRSGYFSSSLLYLL